MSSLEQPRQMHKHKTTSERLLISVRSKLGEALEVNGVPQAASELIQEAEALLRKGEQHLAKPRLASISGEDIFQGADEHARRYLLQTFTELDLGAAAGHQATSPMRRSQVLSNVSIDIPPDGSVISPSSPKTVAQQALHAFSVQEALHKAGAFDFDAIAFAALPEVQGQPITLLGNYMLSSSGYISLLQETGWLSQGDFEGRLTRFLTEIDRRYRPEAIYHSSAHATDVMATICWFLRLPYFSERSSILDYTLSVIAGAVHDVGHPGFNNDFQKTTFSDLALRYNDKSVLENFHVATAFELMRDDADCNWFELLNTEYTENEEETVNLQQYVRRMLVSIVLGTDMAKHNRHMKHLTSVVEAEAVELRGQEAMDRTVFLLTAMVHAADISNPCKPRKIMLDWTERVNLEFWAQGDEEQRLNLPISRMCDRTAGFNAVPAGQIAFIKFVCEPYFGLLARLCPEAEECTSSLAENRKYWEEKDKEKATFDDLFRKPPPPPPPTKV
ncbi:unnamed protein product [Effrenium voratum]|uniref:Phosphodiesterase n=1 Tax=Effrenium voratum TaxID=2562239 RepID=A0AA36IZC5_9DINO|nr:unnamed protein product [Effrenium voratum]|mmetsp:Transcript_97028/g.230885  ORF Transcript_97028/g.230885 Transcript_97028/m.230885 type:complete len:503 (+) Transcript_97028:101-1609(+)